MMSTILAKYKDRKPKVPRREASSSSVRRQCRAPQTAHVEQAGAENIDQAPAAAAAKIAATKRKQNTVRERLSRLEENTAFSSVGGAER